MMISDAVTPRTCQHKHRRTPIHPLHADGNVMGATRRHIQLITRTHALARSKKRSRRASSTHPFCRGLPPSLFHTPRASPEHSCESAAKALGVPSLPSAARMTRAPIVVVVSQQLQHRRGFGASLAAMTAPPGGFTRMRHPCSVPGTSGCRVLSRDADGETGGGAAPSQREEGVGTA